MKNHIGVIFCFIGAVILIIISWFLAKDVNAQGNFFDFWRGLVSIVTLLGGLILGAMTFFVAVE